MTNTFQLVFKRRSVLFCVWLALFVTCGAILPPDDTRLSFLASTLLFFSGIATVMLGISLAVYFIDSWRRLQAAADRYDDRVCLAMDTLIGVPISLLCMILPAAAAITVMTRFVASL